MGEGMEAWATGLALSSPGGPRPWGVGCVCVNGVSSAHTSQLDVCGPTDRSRSSLSLSAFHLVCKEGASELLRADSRGPGALSL